MVMDMPDGGLALRPFKSLVSQSFNIVLIPFTYEALQRLSYSKVSLYKRFPPTQVCVAARKTLMQRIIDELGVKDDGGAGCSPSQGGVAEVRSQ